MPFKRIGPDQYRSPSGRIFNEKQVALYHAHDGFPKKGERVRSPAKKTPPSSRLLKRNVGG